MVEIFDNFLDSNSYQLLQETITGTAFPWYYTERVSAPDDRFKVNDPNCKEGDGFTNIIYFRHGVQNPRKPYEFFNNFFFGLEKLGYVPDDLIVLRLGMKLPKQGYTEETYQIPHVDTYDFEHDTLIYYFNDSDGDTRIFDQVHSIGDEYPSKFTVEQKVSPVGNRLIRFDGFQYHTAAYPINSKRRIVANLNMRKRK